MSGKKYKNKKYPSPDEYSIAPDEALRAKFKHDRKMQKIISLPMFLHIYLCIMMLLNILEANAVQGTLTFSCIVALIGYSFIFSENIENQKKAVRVDVTVLAVLVLPYILEGRFRYLIVQALYIIGVIAGNILARPFIKDIALLKTHPRFPFDNWRQDEHYIQRASQNEVLKTIDNTMNRGKVQTVGYEEFLEGEVKTFELPKHDHEQDFQQREQVYRHHDKADTGYTMDNIKNMYLGKTEEGELNGNELERELMKATAPSKAPEPLPEEFFQQAPVIWRTQKDGTTVMERRAVGSLPAGEKESRSVLP